MAQLFPRWKCPTIRSAPGRAVADSSSKPERLVKTGGQLVKHVISMPERDESLQNDLDSSQAFWQTQEWTLWPENRLPPFWKLVQRGHHWRRNVTRSPLSPNATILLLVSDPLISVSLTTLSCLRALWQLPAVSRGRI